MYRMNIPRHQRGAADLAVECEALTATVLEAASDFKATVAYANQRLGEIWIQAEVDLLASGYEGAYLEEAFDEAQTEVKRLHALSEQV